MKLSMQAHLQWVQVLSIHDSSMLMYMAGNWDAVFLKLGPTNKESSLWTEIMQWQFPDDEVLRVIMPSITLCPLSSRGKKSSLRYQI
ncbi:hypothetical protein C5167_029407 [Papaver somniferum]|nr:hypothetical protein C5167_029407 [Papaver somniferum]